MKLPAASWAFFGLTVIVLIIYAFSLGIFIGSEAVFLKMSDGSGWYTYQCRYLYLTGVRRHLDSGIMAPSPEDAAAKGFCPVFGKTNDDRLSWRKGS
jgi:hypothetical protein